MICSAKGLLPSDPSAPLIRVKSSWALQESVARRFYEHAEVGMQRWEGQSAQVKHSAPPKDWVRRPQRAAGGLGQAPARPRRTGSGPRAAVQAHTHRGIELHDGILDLVPPQENVSAVVLAPLVSRDELQHAEPAHFVQ